MNITNLFVNRAKARRIAQDVKKSCIEKGKKIERRNDALNRARKRAASFRKNLIGRSLQNAEKQRIWQASMRESTTRLIAEFEIPPQNRDTVLSQTDLIARKEYAGDKEAVMREKKKLAEMIEKITGRDVGKSFLRYLEWAQTVNWDALRKENERLI